MIQRYRNRTLLGKREWTRRGAAWYTVVMLAAHWAHGGSRLLGAVGDSVGDSIDALTDLQAAFIETPLTWKSYAFDVWAGDVDVTSAELRTTVPPVVMMPKSIVARAESAWDTLSAILGRTEPFPGGIPINDAMDRIDGIINEILSRPTFALTPEQRTRLIVTRERRRRPIGKTIAWVVGAVIVVGGLGWALWRRGKRPMRRTRAFA